MLAHSFFPNIAFPTRVNNSSGATLIDNVFCKLSSLTLQIRAGILLDEISDHYPYFVCFNVCHTPNKPPRLVKKRLNSDKAIQDMLNDMNQYNFSRKMTNDLSSDPNLITKLFMIILRRWKTSIYHTNLRNFTNISTIMINGYPSEWLDPLKLGPQCT